MTMEIERPLLLVVASLPLAITLMLHLLRRGVATDGWLRMASLSLGMAALSTPSFITSVKTPRVFFLVDRSASCRHYPASVTRLLRDRISHLPPDTEIMIASFDRNLEVLWQGRAYDFPVSLKLGDFDSEGSDLLMALFSLSAYMRSGEKSVVYLFGDGNYVRDHLSLPQRSDRPFSLYPILLPKPPDAAIASVDVPPAKAGEKIRVYVSVASNYKTNASLNIWFPDGRRRNLPLLLRSGVVRASFLATMGEETSVIRINLKAEGDIDDGNNSLSLYLHPVGKSRILYISDSPKRPLGAALTARLPNSVEWRPPQALPEEAELNSFDAILLDDVTATALPSSFTDALAEVVEEDGVGFIMCGARYAFGSGGYAKSPIERILPVNCTPKERLPLALTLLLDSSSSMAKSVFVEDMGERMKFDIAVKSAIGALHAMKRGDSLAVILFKRNPTVIRTLSSIEDEREIAALSAKMYTVRPSGGTNIPSALNAALRQYEKTEEVRHNAVLLLSDGESPTENIDYPKFRELQIKVHTIATGGSAKARTFLKDIARRTGGTYSEARFDPQALRNLFLDILGRIERYLSDYGDYKIDVKGGVPALPPVRLYCRTAPKENAEVLANVDGRYPLFARWRVGAGAVAALTISLDRNGSPDWLKWEKLSSFITDKLLSYVCRRSTTGVWRVTFENVTDRFVLSAPKDAPPLQDAYITIGDRKSRLVPKTPSTYEIERGDRSDFTGIAVVKEKNRVVATLPVNILGSERRMVDVDIDSLKTIATRYGGRLLKVKEFIEHRPEGWSIQEIKIWKFLIVLSLCLLLLSLFVRLIHLRR